MSDLAKATDTFTVSPDKKLLMIKTVGVLSLPRLFAPLKSLYHP
jgi:hypothetical protein